MALSDLIITVYRLRRVGEPLDVTPLLTYRPEARPERIVAIAAGQSFDMDEARVTIDYANGARVLGTVRFAEGEWAITVHRFLRAANRTDALPLYDDMPLADVAPLVGDIGRSVLEPDWRDE